MGRRCSLAVAAWSSRHPHPPGHTAPHPPNPKPETRVLTVAVFDADVFDEVFDELVELNEEGTVTSGRDRQQFTFDGPTIHDLLATEPMAPAARLAYTLPGSNEKCC
jgi:hypothetical protein